MLYHQITDTVNETKKWQYFLFHMKLYFGPLNGIYNDDVTRATAIFQSNCGLKPTGQLDHLTFQKAVPLGYHIVLSFKGDITTDAFPPVPNLQPLTSSAARKALLGDLQFVRTPTPQDKEAIRITNQWDRQHVVKISIPQLIPIKGNDVVYFHKKGAAQLQALFAVWERNGWLDRILTWEGSYAPRLIRGSRTTLSNHAYATAFDINYQWNRLGMTPALLGQKGCVRELASIAHRFGFYWGGFFKRRDGMHFELAHIL